MSKETEEDDAFADQIRTELWNAAGFDSESPMPEVLFHYTSAIGLKGIIENRTIWASDFHHLNDTGEIHTGQKLGASLIQSIFAGMGDYGNGLIGLATAITENLAMANIFVASFSEDDDSLPQWRAYADDGHGVAIGMSLRNDLWPEQGLFGRILVKCSYSEEETEERLRKALSRMREALDRLLAEDHANPRALGLIWAVVRTVVFEVAHLATAGLKHPSFASEREWRFVAHADPWSQREQIKIRPSRFCVTPYIELPFDLTAIRSLKLGPRPTTSPEAEQGVRTLLALNGLAHIHPTGSVSTYR